MFQILENLFTAVLIVNGVITLMLVALVMIVLHRQNRIFGILNEEEKSSSGRMTSFLKKINPFSASESVAPAVNRQAVEKSATASTYRPPEKLRENTSPPMAKESKKVLTVGYPRTEKAKTAQENKNAKEMNRDAKSALKNKPSLATRQQDKTTAAPYRKSAQMNVSGENKQNVAHKKATSKRKKARKNTEKIKPMSKAEEQLLAAVKAG